MIALAPAVLFVVEAAAVLYLLRRLGEPVPPRVVGVGALLAAVLFAPVLLGGRVLLPLDLLASTPPFEALPRTERPANPLQRDLVVAGAPAQALVRGALRAGEWPLWNPAVGAGESLLGRPAAQALDPLTLAVLPLPLERAVGVTAALKVFLAFVFTFLFLRRLGVASLVAAVSGAVAFALSSYVVQWLGWPAATVAVWLPALLVALDRAAAKAAQPVDSFLVAGIVFALAVAGDGDAAFAVALVATAFAFVRLGDRTPAERPRLLAGLALAVLVGLAIAAPVSLVRSSFAADGATHARLDSFVEGRRKGDSLGLQSFDSAAERETYFTELGRRLLPSVAPDALGNSRTGVYWGATNSNEDGGAFAGTAVLVLALAGALVPGGRSRDRRLFALVLLGAVLLVARLPVLVEVADAFVSPSLHRRGLLVAAFALSVLAALALDRLGRLETRRTVALVASAVGLGLALIWIHAGHGHPEGALGSLRLRSFGLQLGTLAVVAGALLAGRRHRAALALVPVAAALELVVFALPVNRPGLASQYYPTPPALAFLAAQTRPGERIVGLGETLPPEVSAVYGLDDVRVAGTDHPDFYTRLIGAITPRRQGRFDVIRNVEHPVLDLLGVRFVLAAPGNAPPPGQTMVFADASGLVFERPKALPLVFLPTAVHVYDPKGPPWERWTAQNPDFRALSLVRDAPGGVKEWRARRPARATAELKALASTRLSARIETGEPRLVATSILTDGGWRALLGGEVVPATLANGPLLAVWVPEGIHDLELVYRPRGFVTGAALAALGLAVACALALRPPRRLG